MTSIPLLILIVFALATTAQQQYQRPQYVIFNSCAYVDWNQDDPSTISTALVEQVGLTISCLAYCTVLMRSCSQMLAAVGTRGTEKRTLAFSMIFYYTNSQNYAGMLVSSR